MRRVVRTSAGSRRRVSSASWSPSDLDNLLAHYDCQDASSITLSGSDVTDLLDQTVNSHDLEQTVAGKRPVYSATAIDSAYPGITFAEANAELLQSPSNGFDFGTVNVRSFAMMFVPQASTNNGRYLSYLDNSQTADFDNGASAAILFDRTTHSAMETSYNYLTNGTMQGPTATAGNMQVLVVIFDGPNNKIVHIVNDGTPTEHTGKTIGNFASGELAIGGVPVDATAAPTSNMIFGELIVTADVLTSEEITNIQTYAARWGL